MSLHDTIEFCRNKVIIDGKFNSLYERYFVDGDLEIKLRDTLQGTDGLSVYIADNPVIMENKEKRIIHLHGSWIDVESYRQFGKLPVKVSK